MAMQMRSLVCLLLVTTTMAGCLTDQSPESVDDNPVDGPVAGAPLPEATFEASGTILASTMQTTPCDRPESACQEHFWEIPETSADGTPQRASLVTIRLQETSATAVDMDLHVFSESGERLASSVRINALEGAGEEVTLPSINPQTLRIEVMGFAGVAMSYSVSGSASMVAVAGAPPAGDVKVYQQGDHWVAERTATYASDVSASIGDADVSTGAGYLTFTGEGDGYRLVAELRGKGDTEQEARARLEEIYIQHDFFDTSRLELNVHAHPGEGGWNDKEAHLAFSVPAAMTWGRVDARTIAGYVEASNLIVDALDAETTAGFVRANNVAVGDLRLASTAGMIEADLKAPLRSGTWTLDSTAGAIDANVVEGSEIGYRVDARTGAGSVRFHFDEAPTTSTDCEYASCHKTAETNGYEGRANQVILNMRTTAGAISAGS